MANSESQPLDSRNIVIGISNCLARLDFEFASLLVSVWVLKRNLKQLHKLLLIKCKQEKVEFTFGVYKAFHNKCRAIKHYVYVYCSSFCELLSLSCRELLLYGYPDQAASYTQLKYFLRILPGQIWNSQLVSFPHSSSVLIVSVNVSIQKMKNKNTKL